jgi:hypothetical protein
VEMGEEQAAKTCGVIFIAARVIGNRLTALILMSYLQIIITITESHTFFLPSVILEFDHVLKSSFTSPFFLDGK